MILRSLIIFFCCSNLTNATARVGVAVAVEPGSRGHGSANKVDENHSVD